MLQSRTNVIKMLIIINFISLKYCYKEVEIYFFHNYKKDFSVHLACLFDETNYSPLK